MSLCTFVSEAHYFSFWQEISEFILWILTAPQDLIINSLENTFPMIVWDPLALSTLCAECIYYQNLALVMKSVWTVAVHAIVYAN